MQRLPPTFGRTTPANFPPLQTQGRKVLRWRHATEVDDILSSWSEMTPAFVVNRLGLTASNSSKPYQLKQIQSLGFSVPETLVTTDPIAAQAFWEHHGTVIYKSVSAIRSRVARLRPEHAQRLADISACPTQFQQYIPGADCRVHVVGDQLFATEVLCDADDYRYPGQHPFEVRACCLPSDLADRCRRLAAAMQLSVAGIDLRRTSEGDWFCFEVNPSPGFTFYEAAANQPIAKAIAELLASGPAREDAQLLSGTHSSGGFDSSGRGTRGFEHRSTHPSRPSSYAAPAGLKSIAFRWIHDGQDLQHLRVSGAREPGVCDRPGPEPPGA